MRADSTGPAQRRIRLGTSGWSYPDWVGNFYPAGSKPAAFLRLYSQKYRTVEIDSTFYGVPKESSVLRWRDETPDDFKFAAKFPKSVTHESTLASAGAEVAAFLNRMELLGDKLGPLLLQFPYGFRAASFEDLAEFLNSLPVGFRYALEIRHKSWIGPRFEDLLREHRIALALIDHPWTPRMEAVTADFTYIRWLGDRKLIENDFSHIRFERNDDLKNWKSVIERISTDGLFVYGYFNNHYEGHSPSSLERFGGMLPAGDGLETRS